MGAKAPAVELEVGERTVRISSPDRVYFPASGTTKLDLVEYYLAVGPGIVNALRGGRACCTASLPAWTATRCTRSGCPPVPAVARTVGSSSPLRPDSRRALRDRLAT